MGNARALNEEIMLANDLAVSLRKFAETQQGRMREVLKLISGGQAPAGDGDLEGFLAKHGQNLKSLAGADEKKLQGAVAYAQIMVHDPPCASPHRAASLLALGISISLSRRDDDVDDHDRQLPARYRPRRRPQPAAYDG